MPARTYTLNIQTMHTHKPLNVSVYYTYIETFKFLAGLNLSVLYTLLCYLALFSLVIHDLSAQRFSLHSTPTSYYAQSSLAVNNKTLHFLC